MKIPEKLDVIVVDFTSGSQVVYIPTSKVDEYEDCYEWMEESEGKKKMIVIMRSQIRNIYFVCK